MCARDLSIARGFSLLEMLLTMAVMVTLAAMALPVYNDLAEVSRLNSEARLIEREFQSARLKAVSTNRSLRVRMNCPATGMLRTVEVLGTSADGPLGRCMISVYPYPAPDQNPFTRPNHDGPIRRLGLETTVSDGAIEFRADGTAWDASTGTALQIGATKDFTVTRRTRTRRVTVNAMGRVLLQ